MVRRLPKKKKKFLIAITEMGNTDLRVDEGYDEEEVFEEWENNTNNIIVVELTEGMKRYLLKEIFSKEEFNPSKRS